MYMDKNFLLQITNELYRLTLLFPKKEPLRYKMREIGDEILASSLRITNFYEYTNESDPLKKCNEERARYIEDFRGNLDILDGFFEVAKNQNWVSQKEILNLQQEYSKLGEELKGYSSPVIPQVEIPFPKNKKTAVESLLVSVPNKVLLAERQQKILEILKEKGRAQVWEIKKIFPEVSKRTLRRDFENLFKKGIIERIGQKNGTFYQLKGRTSMA